MIRTGLPACRWRGRSPEPGKWECNSCEAEIAGSLATVKECLTCPVRDHPDADPLPLQTPAAGSVRHLAYHVYPLGDEWRANLAQLRARMSLFNGRRLIAVATDGRTAGVCDVASELQGCDCEFLPFGNDPVLREMVSYPTLLRTLSAYPDGMDCHWYGHAKGVTSINFAPAVREWRDAMYTAQLDHWPFIRRLLAENAAVGQFMRPRHIIEGSPCRWHFSGTFSWRRHTPLFQRKWDAYDQHWCGSESHLGRIYRKGEVHSLYGDRPPGGLDLYLDSVWSGGVREQHRRWLTVHQGDREQPTLVTVLLTAARQEILVHEAIASVRGQSVPDWQLLVIDAGPLSASGAYARYSGDARVSVLRTGETQADRDTKCIQGWVINRAMLSGRVRGDILLCLCDDDVLDPTWLERVLEVAKRRPDQNAWVGQAERWTMPARGKPRKLDTLAARGVYGEGRPLRCVVDGMQLAVRRAAWRPWPEEKDRAPHADGWWMDAVAAAHPVHAIPGTAGRHRHTPKSAFTKAAE